MPLLSNTVTHNKTTRRPVKYPSRIGAGTRSNRCSRLLDRDALAPRLWINGIVKRSPNASMAAAAMPSAMIVPPRPSVGAASRKTLATFFPEVERFDHHAVPFRRCKLEPNATRELPAAKLQMSSRSTALLYLAARYFRELKLYIVVRLRYALRTGTSNSIR
jgi:hypothetical protein